MILNTNKKHSVSKLTENKIKAAKMTEDFCCFELESTEEEDEGFVYEDDFRIMSILRPSSNSISVTPQPIWANRKVRFGKFYNKSATLRAKLGAWHGSKFNGPRKKVFIDSIVQHASDR